MLWSANDLIGHYVQAADGDIGSVHDILFDDASSKLRYVVVDTGNWLPGRQVLIGLAAVGRPRSDEGRIAVALTRQQIEDSPSLDSDRPISRQDETRIHTHYGWDPYWAAPMAGGPQPLWGVHDRPGLAEAPSPRERPMQERAAADAESGDPHLRSANEVIGYYIEASDGDIGHVEDLLIEDEDWTIRYIVVDTRNWLPGRKVVVSPAWLERVSWDEQKIVLGLTRAQIESSPEYDGTVRLDRNYERTLHDHYGRHSGW
jgi:hypothetical protein